jgi:hypothetical protein
MDLKCVLLLKNFAEQGPSKLFVSLKNAVSDLVQF